MAQSLREYETDGRFTAFNDAVDERLGRNFDKEKREKLLSIHLDSFSSQDHLVEAFGHGEITAEIYFVEFHRLQLTVFRKFNDILGEKDFIRLFDIPLQNMSPIIDPNAFARAHGLEAPPELPADLLDIH